MKIEWDEALVKKIKIKVQTPAYYAKGKAATTR